MKQKILSRVSTLLLVLWCAVYTCHAQQNTFAIGYDMGYAFRTKNATATLNLRYGITDALRIEAYGKYSPSIEDYSMWGVGIDAHYLIPINKKAFFYPIAGLGYAQYKQDMNEWLEAFIKIIEDITKQPLDMPNDKHKRLATHLGMGFEYRFNKHFSANAAGKYLIINDFNQFYLSAGIAYHF